MLDVIWLLGVVVLFLLLALCVKGVDAQCPSSTSSRPFSALRLSCTS